MRVFHHAQSDKGKTRNYQEDDWMVLPHIHSNHAIEHDENNDKSCAAYIIADGMGGAVGGDIASHLAVVTASDFLSTHCSDAQVNQVSSILQNAIQAANKAILDKVIDEPNLKGMGSTMVIGLIENDNLHLCWVGDSRCYVYNRANGFRLLSKDHSYVQTLVDQGMIEESQAANHPNKNLIIRSLGQEMVDGEYKSFQVEHGDLFLFCTDGLNSMLTDQEIEATLAEDLDIETLANNLILQANNNGGLDNITIILVSCTKNEDAAIPSTNTTEATQKSTSIFKWNRRVALILTGLFSTVLILMAFWYRNKVKSDQKLADQILSKTLPDSAAYMNTDDIQDTFPMENIVLDMISIDSAFVDTESQDLSINYEVRMGVFIDIKQAEKELAKYTNAYPNITFDLRSNTKTGYSLYAINFENKKSAQDFLSISKNENGVIIFNKFSSY